jgi:K+-sensing histidine kinase KdpD
MRYPDKKMETSLSSETIQVQADVFLLQIALNNLIDNAIKYAGKDAFIRISTFCNEEKCFIGVSDNGPGIPEHDKKQVFEKYIRLGTTATQRSKGTGLGLYLVKRIMTAMHGSIMLEDQQPSGCRFVIGLSKRKL